MSTIKVDTIATRTGSGNITLSNSLADVTINRTGNGVAQTIQNSGTTVGQIGVNSTDNMYLVSTNTGFKLLKDEAAIAPAQSGGSNHDNALDLGVSGVRWKDLYLSGGLKIGGTGAANTLDDYEEGTFTPELQIGGSTTGITYNSRSGHYTKVGRVVHITMEIYLSSKGSQTGTLNIHGLPFSSASGIQQSVHLYDDRFGNSGADNNQLYLSSNSTNFALFEKDTDQSNNGRPQHDSLSNTSYFVIGGSYHMSV